MESSSHDSAAGALTPERLTEQIGWLKALARGLVRDEHLAEELTQDTLATALEHRPSEVRSVRAWLGRVMRNRAAENARSQANARDRESRVARPEATQADELLERVRAQKHVAEALMELSEPYRTTLVLRFYEELPPRAIAKRMELPVSTVKSRLQRGLAALKSDLDTRYGSRSNWVLALMPLATGVTLPPIDNGSTPFEGGLTLTGTAMNLKLVAAVTVALAAGTWAVLRDVSPEDGATSAEHPQLATAGSSGASGQGAPRSGRESDRQPMTGGNAIDGVAATASLPIVAGDSPAALRGRVFDGSGRPVEGLRLGVSNEPVDFTSQAGGWFELAERTTPATLETRDPNWEMVFAGRWLPESQLEPIIVAAPRISVSGNVVDIFGDPIDGARLEWTLPESLATRIDADLGSVLRREWKLESDADGRFDWSSAPAVEGALLRVAHPDYDALVVEAPQADREDLQLRMIEEGVDVSELLVGRVWSERGLPVENAWVQLGLAQSQTDEFGRFRLDLSRASQGQSLLAIAQGYQLSQVSAPETPSEDDERLGWPNQMEIYLETPSLSIRGQVLDAQGEPVVGARVWPRDAEIFGAFGTHALSREGLAAGAPLPPGAVASLAELGVDPQAGLEHGSATPVGAPNAMFYFVRTDDAGRFEVGGLQERDYELAVLDGAVGAGLSSEPIAAGSQDVSLVLPTEGSYTPLCGRVVTPEGLPVADVAVTPFLSAYRSRHEVFGGGADFTRFFLGKAVVTDEDGRFCVDSVPRRNVSFHLISDLIPPSYASVDDVSDPSNFVIQVEARAQLTVATGSEADAPTGFRILDGDRAPMPILEMRADGYSTHSDFDLTGGRSGVVTVTTSARWLVWLRDGQVLGEEPVFLEPGANGTFRR